MQIKEIYKLKVKLYLFTKRLKNTPKWNYEKLIIQNQTKFSTLKPFNNLLLLLLFKCELEVAWSLFAQDFAMLTSRESKIL